MGLFKGIAVLVLLVAIGSQFAIRVLLKEPTGPESRIELNFGDKTNVTIERTKEGVPQVYPWK
jgi:hypothetical protein